MDAKTQIPTLSTDALPVHHEVTGNMADWLVRMISHRSAAVFGVPGGALEPLFDALSRAQKEGLIQYYTARQESGAANMADGYARETGNLAVCCATTGPGTTNMLTGIATANVDKTIGLALTVQVPTMRFARRGALQGSFGLDERDIDTVRMLKGCTVYSDLIHAPNYFLDKVYHALHAAYHTRGFAHLSIPGDILRFPIPPQMRIHLPESIVPGPEWEIEPADLTDFIHLTHQAKKIVIYTGHGCSIKTMDQIIQFAEKTGAKMISGPMGKRWVDYHHPQYVGVFGFAGHESARTALDEADCIIAAGTALGELATEGWSKRLLNHRLIHIDEDHENFANSYMAQRTIFANIRQFFERVNAFMILNDGHVPAGGPALKPSSKLLFHQKPLEHPEDHGDQNVSGLDSATLPTYHERETIGEGNHLPSLKNSMAPGEDDVGLIIPKDRIAYLDNDKANEPSDPIKPQYLLRKLGEKLPEDARIFVDTGNSWAWSIHYLETKSRGNFFIGTNFGAMGWAIGAAVGAAVGNILHKDHDTRPAPVICVTGDGSMLMAGQEITVAKANGLCVIYIVLNDGALGMVKHGQKLGNAEPIGCILPDIDFAKVAEGYGVRSFVVNSSADFDAIDFEALAQKGETVLIDARIDPDEVPPMRSRVSELKNGGTPGSK